MKPACYVRALLGCLVGLMPAAAFPAPDLALWQELDMVPMPKEIELSGRELPVAGAVIVLGDAPSRQDQIGAQWINDRVVALGGEALAVLQAGQASQASLRIIVGTGESNPLIAAAVQAGQLQVGPGEPGEKGYVIAPRAAGQPTELLLAGADRLGALYACVTLGELLVAREGGVLVREARVTDWPDFQHFMLGDARTGSTVLPELADIFSAARSTADPSDQLRESYLSAMRWYFDFLLRRKVSTIQYYMNLDGFRAVPRRRAP